MTTFESFKKFGLETRGFVGGILMVVGGALTLLGLAVVIADHMNDTFGLEGVARFIFLFIFFGGGLGMLFAGARVFLKDKKRVDGLREAYENNDCVMADIVSVRAQTSLDKSSDNMFTGVRYREYYLVECRYKDPSTGVAHIYYSPALYFDPTELIVAKQVPVYIDRDNEKNFFVDIYQAMTPVEIHKNGENVR